MIENETVHWKGRAIRLTATERRLLRELVCGVPHAITRRDLCVRALGSHTGGRRVDVHVTSLRRKLLRTGIRIPLCERGGGYSLTTCGPSVLVVEDHDELARVIVRVVRAQTDANVCVCGTASAVYAALEQQAWELAIIDVLLPWDSSSLPKPYGLAVADDILIAGTQSALLVSSDPDFVVEAFGRRLPFLLKPFDLAALTDIIDGMMHRRAAD